MGSRDLRAQRNKLSRGYAAVRTHRGAVLQPVGRLQQASWADREEDHGRPPPAVPLCAREHEESGQ
eukprot:2784777-Ditylum_brightwellii.AAC.1